MSTKWSKAFLSALRETANVRAACEAAGVSRSTVYGLRSEDPAFAADWADSLEEAADLLEAEAVRRARIGVQEPVIHQGVLAGMWVDPKTGDVVSPETAGAVLVPLTVTKYSDTLLIFLLKGARPEKYRERVSLDANVKLSAQATDIIKELSERDARALEAPGNP